MPRPIQFNESTGDVALVIRLTADGLRIVAFDMVAGEQWLEVVEVPDWLIRRLRWHPSHVPA